MSDPTTPTPVSEDRIRSQMQRGLSEAAERVPLEHRAPISVPVEGTVQCNDGMPHFQVHGFANDPKATTRCDVVDDGSALPAEVLGSRGRVATVSRATTALPQIPVQRVDLESGTVEHDKPLQLKTATAVVGHENVVYAERPAASDNLLGVMTPDYEVQVPTQTARMESSPVLSRAKPAPAPRVEKPVNKTVPAGFTPAPTRQASPEEAPKKRERTRVVLRSNAMGVSRVRVDYVGVSATCVLLGYIDDEDATIIEPPINSKNDPITVEADGKSYLCAYYGLSCPLRVGSNDLLLVVLVRVDQ